MKETYEKETNRCPVCGRIIPAHIKECTYCLRDVEHPVKIIKVREDENEGKRSWVKWVLLTIMILLALYVFRRFLHLVDGLLKPGPKT